MNILQAIADPNLFASWFKDRETWNAWRTFLAALFGLPIEDEALYATCTGGRPVPTRQAGETFLIVGRRGGKSFICALVGVYLASFRSYALAPDEPGVVMILAADRRQARVIFRYVKAFFEGVPMSEKTKSEIYQAALPMLNSGRVELLDNKTLRTQLVGLERRTARGGKDSIDHRPGGRDDVVNAAAAGALISCAFSVPISPDAFASGVIKFGRPGNEEQRTLWGQLDS